MHKSRLREKREYLHITASKSQIIVIYWVIFSAEPDLYLNVPLLLVFSITPFKIDQNQNQNHSTDKVQNLGNERR